MFSPELFAASLILTVIISRGEGSATGDISCRTKIRNMVLKYCLNDGVRLKRDTLEVNSEDHRDLERAPRSPDKGQISPEAVSALAHVAAPIISDIVSANDRRSYGQQSGGRWDQGYTQRQERPDGSYPNYPPHGFQPPALGDDLGFGLSYNDMEELYREMMERLPRAAKNKDETFNMITTYAARCCNDDDNDTNCNYPGNGWNCP